MIEKNNLSRFIDAQLSVYETAFAEIKNGRKVTHWMWFIFPQIGGLGYSETARFYAVRDVQEAADFLTHPVLGQRLLKISRELLALKSSDAYQIFGSPDDMKLKSSMTLFSAVPNASPVFDEVLDKFFQGIRDQATLMKIDDGR